jgi:hypothetical protein
MNFSDINRISTFRLVFIPYAFQFSVWLITILTRSCNEKWKILLSNSSFTHDYTCFSNTTLISLFMFWSWENHFISPSLEKIILYLQVLRKSFYISKSFVTSWLTMKFYNLSFLSDMLIIYSLERVVLLPAIVEDVLQSRFISL